MDFPRYLIKFESSESIFLPLKEARDALKSGAKFGREILDKSGFIETPEPEDIEILRNK